MCIPSTLLTWALLYLWTPVCLLSPSGVSCRLCSSVPIALQTAMASSALWRQLTTTTTLCLQGKRGPGVHLGMDPAGKVRLYWESAAEPPQTGRARRGPRDGPRTAAAMAGNRAGPVFCAMAAWRSVYSAGGFCRIPPPGPNFGPHNFFWVGIHNLVSTELLCRISF